MNDSEITALLKKSSQEGIEMLIRQYRGFVGAIISRILAGREEDIAECISDAFVSVWNHRQMLDSNRNTLKGFVACIARNTAINRYRKLSKERIIPLNDEELADDIDLSVQLEKKCDSQTVQSLIFAMTEPDREIFIRRHYFMQPIREIADSISMSEKQVKNRLYQSRLRLKDQLIKRGFSI